MARNIAQQGGEQSDQTSASAAADHSHCRLTFWRQPFVQNVLPFMTSLLLHLGVILLGLATFQAVTKVSAVVKDQIIIPDAALERGAEAAGLPNPGPEADPNIASDAKVEVQEQARKMAERSSISAGVIGGDTANDGVIGRGMGIASLRMGGASDGEGDAHASPFGVPGGSGGLDPRSPFMGVGGNATRIVYLVDASGSMLVRKNIVEQSLKESIGKLKPVQFFNVIFYHPGGVNEIFAKDRLVPATPEHKRAASEFAEGYRAESNGQPEDASIALRIAMGMRPQLIYFLTDGFDRGSNQYIRKLRDELGRLNASKDVHVSVIYIADQGQFEQLIGGTDARIRDQIVTDLRALADENGGRFRILQPD